MSRQPFALPVLLALLLASAASTAHADARVPAFFSDHMVMQRDVKLPVWGWADAGEKVTVSLAGNTATATAGKDGKWRVALPALKAGGPHALTIKANNTLTVKDVLIGEVWLCSGQSNMEWTVSRSANAKQEIAAADYPLIRHMKAPRTPSGSPQDDINTNWQVCSPQTAAGFTACGYFMARKLHKELKVPIGLINSSWGGTRIEPWTPPVGFEGVPQLKGIADAAKAVAGKKPRSHQQPTVLYNGMIHALVGYPIRGAIWYQGESNHSEGMLYYHKKRALVEGWRKLWKQDFPFYFVQIAPFQYGNEDPTVLATFWEAQAKCLDIPKTGMVVTNDIATLRDIHPPNKQDVGKRLALLALNRDYGKSVVDSGPQFKAMKIEGETARVTMTNTAGGLKARDDKPLSHFEIAGARTGFVPAEATIDGDAVVLRSPKVKNPVAMRFAWHKLAEPNLVNGAGLPTAAFRAGEVPKPDHLSEVKDAKGYKLVYDLDLAKLGPSVAYDVNEAAKVGKFERVGYLLELQRSGESHYVWVAMNAFTEDASKLGIPTVQSKASFQTNVSNMTVESNVKGITTGKALNGNIEFWPNNYGPVNTANVPGADAKLWDFGDQPVNPVDGYGCMQVHHAEAKQTVFAINQWKAGGGGANIGIGNSSADKRTRDWTFVRNGASYSHKRLRVFVR